MKQTRYKWLGILTSIALTVAVIASCSREDLTKDLEIYVGTDFLVNKFTVQVVDAQDPSKVPADAIITIDGKDKDKIFSLLGDKELSLSGNLVGIAIKKADLPSETAPLEFSVTISAPNYLTKTVDYKLTSLDAEMSNIDLINLNAPPQGITIAQNQFKSEATGVSSKVQITSTTDNTAELSQVTVLPNTRMLTKEGVLVTGNIQSVLINSDINTDMSFTEIPNWGESVKVKKANGQITDNVIDPAGFFKLNMTAGGAKVEKFSAPVEAVSYIDANTFNPEKGRTIQVGDELSILSLSEGEEAWNEEGKAVIQKADNGRMKVVFQLNHLSHYTYCWQRNFCDVKLKVSSAIIKSTDPCSNPLSEYFYKIVNATTPSKVYEKGYSAFQNGRTLEYLSLPTNTKIKVLIYANKNESIPLYTTTVDNPCGVSIVTIPANALIDNSVVASVKISGVCGGTNGSPSTYLLPSVCVYYREYDNSNPNKNSRWHILTTITPNQRDTVSEGCARGLEIGKTYDFSLPLNNLVNGKPTGTQMSFAKDLNKSKGFTITRAKQTFTVNSTQYGIANQVFTFEMDSNNRFNLNYKNCPLPAQVCDVVYKSYTSAFVPFKKKK